MPYRRKPMNTRTELHDMLIELNYWQLLFVMVALKTVTVYCSIRSLPQRTRIVFRRILRWLRSIPLRWAKWHITHD